MAFDAKKSLFVKVTPRRASYFPAEIIEESAFLLEEKLQTLFIGGYFGFTLLIIILNVFYFFVFEDDAFIYYSLFLACASLGLFMSDGMLNVFNVPDRVIDFLIVLAYTLVAIFSSLFASSFLQIDIYYPKLKYLAYSKIAIIVVLGILYLITDNFYYLISINILVFGLFLIYWLAGLSLFKKSNFIKVFTLAFLVLFILSINYYVFKVLGISTGNLNATHIKLGGAIEMIVLSVAVLYRMKALKRENGFMRDKIIFYSFELEKVAASILINQRAESINFESLLSIREHEIFLLIVAANSNKEIAQQLNISVNTVKYHIKNVYEKLQVKSRKEVLSIAINKL